MGWDAGLKRKLAVPIAVSQTHTGRADPLFRTRMLKLSDESTEECEVLSKIAENRMRIEALVKEIDENPGDFEATDSSELDYLKASIQLGLLEITGELEDVPYSDELFEEATA